MFTRFHAWLFPAVRYRASAQYHNLLWSQFVSARYRHYRSSIFAVFSQIIQPLSFIVHRYRQCRFKCIRLFHLLLFSRLRTLLGPLILKVRRMIKRYDTIRLFRSILASTFYIVRYSFKIMRRNWSRLKMNCSAPLIPFLF